MPPAKPAKTPTRTPRRGKKPAAAAAKKRVRVPFAVLRARKELAERTLDDIRNLMADADPIGAPADFAVREQKALALFSELNSLLPSAEPMSPEERARLERELADELRTPKPHDPKAAALRREAEKLAAKRRS